MFSFSPPWNSFTNWISPTTGYGIPCSWPRPAIGRFRSYRILVNSGTYYFCWEILFAKTLRTPINDFNHLAILIWELFNSFSAAITKPPESAGRIPSRFISIFFFFNILFYFIFLYYFYFRLHKLYKSLAAPNSRMTANELIRGNIYFLIRKIRIYSKNPRIISKNLETSRFLITREMFQNPVRPVDFSRISSSTRCCFWRNSSWKKPTKNKPFSIRSERIWIFFQVFLILKISIFLPRKMLSGMESYCFSLITIIICFLKMYILIYFHFWDDIAKYKILPKLIMAYEYGDAGPNIMIPLFKLGRLLAEDEYQRRIVPCLVKVRIFSSHMLNDRSGIGIFLFQLFGSPDRTTRVKLLERIDEFAPHLTSAVINEKIFGYFYFSLFLTLLFPR